MPKKPRPVKYDFGDVLPLKEALTKLGDRVRVCQRQGYFLDGNPVKVFAVLEAAGKLPKEGTNG